MVRPILLCLLTVACAPSSFSQQKVYLDITTDVNVVVTDPFGKRTGVDSRFSKPYKQWTWLKEIPSSEIGFERDDESQPSMTHFEGVVTTPSGDGTFRMDLIGNETRMTYISVSVKPRRNVSDVQKAKLSILSVPIEKDSSITYLFTYHGAFGAPVTLAKVVSGRTLFQDVAAMRKLSWITSQAVSDKYSDLIIAYNVQMQHANYTAARSKLMSILQNVSADSSTSLTVEACKSLRADVESLLKQKP